VAAFLTEIQFPTSAGPRNFTLREVHTEFNKFRDTSRTFFNDGPYDFFLAEPGTRLERVTHVQFKGILFARH
jgi:hypothetical protein